MNDKAFWMATIIAYLMITTFVFGYIGYTIGISNAQSDLLNAYKMYLKYL